MITFVGNVEGCAVGTDCSNADIAGPQGALSQAAQRPDVLRDRHHRQRGRRLDHFRVQRPVQRNAQRQIAGHTRDRDGQGHCGRCQVRDAALQRQRPQPGPQPSQQTDHGGVSRSTYPTPRTVWISRGSSEASVLRRR